MMRASRPGLYVHIPFCSARCHYCAFASGVYRPDAATRYLDALEREFHLRSADIQNVPTAFIGGGTPSVLDPPLLERLLSFIPMPENRGEASCELNPETTTREKLELLRDAGVNRVSFGVQTFSPSGLRLLGRRHDARQAVAALESALRSGFASCNIDLIVGWPGQTMAGLNEDLRIALDLGTTHVSCYNLALEDATPLPGMLAALGLPEKDDGEARLFWDAAEQALTSRGFEHYEISNYAKPGHHCRHNVSVWQGGDYVGLGPGAHSHRRGRRFANAAALDEYVGALERNRAPEAFSEILEPAAKARECAVFWLRLAQGIDLEAFQERTSFDLMDLYATEMPRLLDSGALEIRGEPGGRKFLRFAREAFPLADSYLVDLV